MVYPSGEVLVNTYTAKLNVTTNSLLKCVFFKPRWYSNTNIYKDYGLIVRNDFVVYKRCINNLVLVNSLFKML